MKNIVWTASILFLILINGKADAVTFKINKICSNGYVFNKNIPIKKSMTVSQLTAYVLKRSGIKHKISGKEVKSILNTPAGMDAIDVYNNETMAAFGWCVLLNGKLLKQPIYKQVIKSDKDSIQWFYGSAYLVRDKWKDMCVPSFKRKPRHFCKR